MTMEWSNETREVLESIVAYVEKREELAKAMDSYQGYSPEWALSLQIAERNDAEKRVGAALEALVQSAVRRALEPGNR